MICNTYIDKDIKYNILLKSYLLHFAIKLKKIEQNNKFLLVIYYHVPVNERVPEQHYMQHGIKVQCHYNYRKIEKKLLAVIANQLSIMSINPKCVFCKIVKGEDPCTKIYEVSLEKY